MRSCSRPVEQWTRGEDWTSTAKPARQQTGEDRLGETLQQSDCYVRSGDIIDIEDATNITREMEHRLFQFRPRDLVTVLPLKGVSGRDDHFDEHENQEEKR